MSREMRRSEVKVLKTREHTHSSGTADSIYHEQGLLMAATLVIREFVKRELPSLLQLAVLQSQRLEQAGFCLELLSEGSQMLSPWLHGSCKAGRISKASTTNLVQQRWRWHVSTQPPSLQAQLQWTVAERKAKQELFKVTSIKRQPTTESQASAHERTEFPGINLNGRGSCTPSF